MSRHLVLSFRFLAPWFHGRGNDGEPEWPPSPLRAFQALVAAAARAGKLVPSRPALAWLEAATAPCIIASEACGSAGYRLSVPHNAMDIVGKEWVRGGEGNAAKHRAMKDVRPSRLPDDAVVHFVWPLTEEDPSHVDALVGLARSVVALGWGVDLVVGDGAVHDAPRLAELRASLRTWEPRHEGSVALRTPVEGTLDALERRHAAFLSRTSLADPTLRPPPALSAFATRHYGRTDEQPSRFVAAFSLMRLHEDRFRAFDTAPRGMAVAGMLRHAVRRAAESAGWDSGRVGATVMGHGSGDAPRLLLVPIPSIEYRGGGDRVGAVRRALIFSTDRRSEDVSWAARVLGGAELVDESTGEIAAVLAAVSPADRAFTHYVGESRKWATVTPVVLPGHDDRGGLLGHIRGAGDPARQKRLIGRLEARREALIRKALRQAGLSEEIASSAQIETRQSGFIAGVEPASRYAVPRHLCDAPRFHVRLTWPQSVRGPLCVGGGRFSGLGIFVRVMS